MLEVTGGSFWKPYKSSNSAPREVASPAGDGETPAGMDPTALDEQPEDDRDFTHEHELGEDGGEVGDEDPADGIRQVSDAGDVEQDAEDLRHETGAASQVAHQQGGAERAQADMQFSSFRAAAVDFGVYHAP